MEKYFAQKDSKELINYLMQFNGQWNNLTTPYQNGIGAIWARNINYYYSNVLRGDAQSSLNFEGQLGELVKMAVPQARSLNTQFLSLTTKQKLHFEPQALSNDAATLADTRIAQALSDQIVIDQNLDQKAYRLAELTSILGSAYLKTCWSPSSGKNKGFDDAGQPVYNGGLKISVHSVYDVSFDHTKDDFYEQDWAQVKSLRNRWDLIAEHPEFEMQIRGLPKAFNEGDTVFYWQMNLDQDVVWVYEFFHRSTPALPLGRYTIYCDPTTPFYDEHSPYVNDNGAYIPLAEMKPEPIAGTGFGYPNFCNILPLQEMLDHNMSAIASNNNAFAVKSILNPIGNDINVKHIQGLKFINYTPMNMPGAGKPEVLDLNTSSAESYKFSDMIVKNMQQIYAINSAIRGEPGAGITSGTAIATLSANAIEFAQNFTKSYINCLETSMFHSILGYANFATEEQVVAVAGPNDSTIAKKFVGEDLKNIKRVQCGIANPLLATAAGKLEVANNLLKTGQFSVKRYLKILEGAPVDALYDREFDCENFIQEENDALRGDTKENVVAAITDDHALHMQAHAALLDNFAIRNDANATKKIMDHIYDHFAKAKMADPLLFQMIKTGQMPPMQQMQQIQAQATQPPPQPQMPPPPKPAPQIHIHNGAQPMAHNGPPPGPMKSALPPNGPVGAANPASAAQPQGTIQNQNLGGMAPLQK